MNFYQLAIKYLDYLKVERNASPYTVRNYTTDLASFQKFMRQQGVSFSAVDRSILRSYLGWLMAEGFARASIARKVSALRSFHKYLVREEIITVNPLAMTSTPKLERRLPSFLSVEEARRLVEAPDARTPAGMRDRALLELLYASGLRVSEIVGLDTDRVDIKNRQVRVLGKGSKERISLMGKPAVAALELYMKEGRPALGGVTDRSNAASPLFINRYGRRMAVRRVQLIVDAYAKKAGIIKHVHPHMLRHTFATHLLDGDADLRVVQELLGHASLTSTQVYTHVTQRRAKKVYLAAHPLARIGNKEAR